MAKEYKIDLEDKIEQKQTDELFSLLMAAADGYDPNSYVLVPNPAREQEYADCGWDLLQEYGKREGVKLLRRTDSRMASFKLVFKELDIEDTKRFMEIIAKADNLTIESHTDGTTHLYLTFHNYTRKVNV